ncbi:MAG: homogentisate 1,2-dioxygenase, partial [Flavobacteriaceae bacterium]|nr:homogentisate 1,2-dioxygenase [Flavobacteriaceae bacterium]
MPLYHTLGKIPHKRHTVFEKPDGSLYYEQLFGTIGFDGMSSLLYHIHRPTMVKEVQKAVDISPKAAIDHNITSRLLKGLELPPQDDYLESRKVILFNNDVHVGLAAPRKSMTDYFYKNADADELLFIHEGTGVVKTFLGEIPFEYGDYILIPRGMIYQIHFDTDKNRLLVTESYHPIYTPKRYRNWFGQHLEHSPFCERDFKLPQNLQTFDEKGEFLMKVKKEGQLHHMIYASHPFDVVGWDGYNYPYGFSIHDFEPITGRVHQPPPVHQTFET